MEKFEEFMANMAKEHPKKFSKTLYCELQLNLLLSCGEHSFDPAVQKKYKKKGDKLKELFSNLANYA